MPTRKPGTKPRAASKPTKGRKKKVVKKPPESKRAKTTSTRVVRTLRSSVRISDENLRRIKKTWAGYEEAGTLPEAIAGPVRIIVHLWPEREGAEGDGYQDGLICTARVYQRSAGDAGDNVPMRPRLMFTVPREIDEVYVGDGFEGTHVRVFADGSTMLFINAWGGVVFGYSFKTLRLTTLARAAEKRERERAASGGDA